MVLKRSLWARIRAFVVDTLWFGYVFKLFVWLSQGLNTLLGPLLNGLLLLEVKLRKSPRESAWRFGFPDETLSSVFGKNRYVSVVSKGMAWLLDKIDKGHVRRAMELDEGRQFKPKSD